MADENTPLIGSNANGADGGEPVAEYVPPVDANTLPYYWPCMVAGALAQCAATCLSVELTRSILDDPTRATYYQDNWWIVWLVGVALLSVAIPVFFFSAIVMTIVRATCGAVAAFPTWISMMLTTNAFGCVFAGFFTATYPFSFFLQMQIYGACATVFLTGYTVLGMLTQCIPGVGGFNGVGAWVFCAGSSIFAYVKMGDIFTYLDYPDSRTAGKGLWHPWVAIVIQLIFVASGLIQSMHGHGDGARFFADPEPVAPSDKEKSAV